MKTKACLSFIFTISSGEYERSTGAKQLNLQTGFTLIELQIAILVLLLIFSVTGGVLYYTSKLWSLSDALANHHNRQSVVTNLLRQQINGIIPLQNTKLGRSELYFEGSTASIFFIGNLPEYLVKGGPWLINIALNDSQQLIFAYRYFNPKQSWTLNKQAEYQRVVLLNEVERFSISYISATTKAMDTSWREKWYRQNALPGIIKVNIKQKGKNGIDIIEPVYASQAGRLHFHHMTPVTQ